MGGPFGQRAMTAQSPTQGSPWYQSPYLWGAGLGLGFLGDILGASQYPNLQLPQFGQQYMGQARKALGPGLQSALAGSAALGAQELSGLGANLASMGISGGPKLEAISGLAQQGQAARNMQLYGQWQKQITDLASQLYQWDMQRRIAEYEAATQRTGGGVSGAFSQIGQTFAGALPFLLA